MAQRDDLGLECGTASKADEKGIEDFSSVPNFLLSICGDQAHFDFRASALLHNDRFAARFETTDIVGILIGAGRNFLPGKDSIIAGRHIVKGESAALIGGDRRIQIGPAAS